MKPSLVWRDYARNLAFPLSDMRAQVPDPLRLPSQIGSMISLRHVVVNGTRAMTVPRAGHPKFMKKTTRLVARDLQISNVHNHQPAFLDLSTLVLGTCSQLELFPVLVEARERPTISGGRVFDIINGIVRHQDRDDCGAIEH
jgi:hypothetical protein